MYAEVMLLLFDLADFPGRVPYAKGPPRSGGPNELERQIDHIVLYSGGSDCVMRRSRWYDMISEDEFPAKIF